MNSVRITFRIEDETGRKAAVEFSSEGFTTTTEGPLYPSEIALVADVVNLVKRTNHFPPTQKHSAPIAVGAPKGKGDLR